MRLYPEAAVILMVIRLNLICTYSKNRSIGALIAIAYPFLLLRLDNYDIFYIFSYVLIVLMAEFMLIHVNLYLDCSGACPQK